MKYQRIKGTFDILPEESGKWVRLEEIVRDVMRRFNYKEIRPPIFEMTELFARGIGEGTDIVSKEMFSFTDMGGRSLTLRPEATASVVRAFIEESLGKKAPLNKVFYIGPMFRQEKPQKGRQRQFHQFGAEAIGSNDPKLDAEIIAVSVQILRECGISQFEVAINSVATPVIREKHRVELLKYVQPIADQLPAVDREKIYRNPLRLFDSKEQLTKTLMKDAPLLEKFYDDAVKRDFETVKATLEKLDIGYVVDPRLVRGLDYYTRTAFEIRSDMLGAQDALSGGGRYDLLIQELGGDPTPAVGFAAGMERTLMAMESIENEAFREKPLDVFVVAVNPDERSEAAILAGRLREARLAVDLDYLDRSQKSQMKEASRQNARFAIFVFSDDLADKHYTIKNMASTEQQKLPYEGIMRVLVTL
jgi:histidyl-tRNA synthetase